MMEAKWPKRWTVLVLKFEFLGRPPFSLASVLHVTLCWKGVPGGDTRLGREESILCVDFPSHL